MDEDVKQGYRIHLRIYNSVTKKYDYLKVDNIPSIYQYEQSIRLEDKNKKEIFATDKLKVTNPDGVECGEFDVVYSREGTGYFFNYGDKSITIGMAVKMGFTFEIVGGKE